MEKRISGHTKLMALYGSPVGHSGSPAMYNFAFQKDGLDYVYIAIDMKEEDMEEAMSAAKLYGMYGGNFTMPCKKAAARLMDELSPAAEIIGAINCFVNDDGKLKGYITDGEGFIRNLAVNGVDIKDKKIVLMGCGGAGTAILVQMVIDGVEKITAFDMTASLPRANDIRTKLLEKYPEGNVILHDFEEKEAFAEAINDCDILINATCMGMKPYDDVSLVDPSLYRKEMVVADVVYNPLKTKMLTEAEEAGCKIVTGSGMLLYQGVANYKIFFGKDYPVAEYEAYQKSLKS